MGIFSSLRSIYSRGPAAQPTRASRLATKRQRRAAHRSTPRLQLEALEPRRLMAADSVPEVLLGSVYFEEATGDDSRADTIEVSFVGGAAGTTLDRVTINGDKQQDGLSVGDVFFDTAAGGLGAFHHGGLSIVSANGFTINSVTVVDGGSQIVFDLSGFDAGETLELSVDADEAQYVNGSEVDANSLVEGAEFQRSILVGEFSAPGFVDLTLSALYWDAFDDERATDEAATGLTLNLPNDAYSPSHDYTDRTAGAVAHAPQIPLARLSGWVYHDRSDEGNFDRGSEQGIGGVTLELLDANGNKTGIRTTTSTNPETLGYYEFRDLLPGTYGVCEVHPENWLDGKDKAGSHGGAAASEAGGRVDKIFGAVLNYGDRAVEYNFGELLPGSIAGRVSAHTDGDCDFDHPEILLAGVRIDLLDASGNFIRSMLTDAKGEYKFTGLGPGIYQVREHHPETYYDGDERIGSAGGATHDVPGQFSMFTGIQITSGLDAIQYDFCEHVGVMLSGNVYHDRDDDGNFDRGPEEGITGVLLKLLDQNGNDTGLRATTDSAGFYKFNNLAAGKYRVMEVHPSGWLDGKDTPGNLGGVADLSPPGDMLSQIMINWGEMGTEYNFGELLPGSIHGIVVVSTDPECDPRDGEPPIAGVQIDLLDATGNVIATTHTNTDGTYSFTGLRPGVYSVREHQPIEYFDLDAHLGTGDGSHLTTNLLADITVGSDQHLFNYDFCEEPAAELSGYVYVDGPPIVTNEPLTPDQIADVRDGRRTSDDRPLAGVTLQLRQGELGNPITVSQTLPGHYSGSADDPVYVVTDENGYYHFTGLKAGIYAVVELSPEGVIDSFDRVGTTGGFAANPELTGDHEFDPTSGPPPTQEQQETIDQFRQQFGTDALVGIPLAAGEHSLENNFSEITTRPTPVPPYTPPDPPPLPPVFARPGAPFVPRPLLPPYTPPKPRPELIGGTDGGLAYTWHLSVVNAGRPRQLTPEGVRYQLTSTRIEAVGWHNVQLQHGRWMLALVDNNQVTVVRDDTFGTSDAIPVVGDYNGDGVCDIGVFIEGQWYLDLNGNGQWDEGDLWAELGTKEDLPVTGDWDADGKTDIGIYGPIWARDPWAIAREPGLPDAANYPHTPADKLKNVPPTEEDATSGARLLKRTAEGTNRADLIDHVFHYGLPTDTPVAGDWNGDGIRQIGVFRDGEWNLDTDGDGRFTENDLAVTYGVAGDRPVIGDFNGDSFEEIGVFRAGKWIVDTNRNYELDAQDKVFELGAAGDTPIVGDWNDDGTDDPGVYQPGAAETTAATPRRAG